MATPGVTVSSSAVGGQTNGGADLGTFFVAGITEMGPLAPDPLRPIRSLDDYVKTYGTRTAYATSLFDAVDSYFRSGGSRVFVGRVVGPAAASASVTLQDRNGTPASTLTVRPKGPGAYGAGISVQVVDGLAANTFNIIAVYNSALVEQSPDLTSPSDAVAWSNNTSRWLKITDAGSGSTAPANNPKVTASPALVALTGGSDDRTNITDTQWSAALAGFPRAMGPGLVAQPGRTTSAAHALTVAHGIAFGRQAILDGPKGASQAALSALSAGVQAVSAADEFASLFAPWLVIPGTSGNAPRTVAPSGVAAGVMSRQVTGGLANRAAAGPNGAVAWVRDTDQAEFTDTERGALNDVGVNVFRKPYGSSDVALYGYRTLDISGGFRQLANQLLRLRIQDEGALIGEQFVFGMLDGRGQLLAEFNAAIASMLQTHYSANELYGATSDEAYLVDTGVSVNTSESIANGELRSVVSVRMSPTAEMVSISIVKYPVTESLV